MSESPSSTTIKVSASVGEYLKKHQEHLKHQEQQHQISNISNFSTPTKPTMALHQNSSHYNSIHDQVQPFGNYEKTYYTNLNNVPYERYYTTAAEQSSPNTILITNNFSQSQTKLSHRSIPTSISAQQMHMDGTISGLNNNFNNSSIRIINTHNNGQENNNNLSNPLHFTPNSDVDKGLGKEIINLQQISQQPIQMYQQPQLHLQQIQIPSHIQQQQQQSLLSLAQHLNSRQYVSSVTPSGLQDSNNKVLNIHEGNEVEPSTTTSTVVLDRINICINNHYADTVASGSLPASTTLQPSPSIPAIQHKPSLKTENNIGIESNTVVIHEPDSTTTPNTPPTSPDTPSPPFQISGSKDDFISPIKTKKIAPTTTTKIATTLEKSKTDIFVTLSPTLQSENARTDQPTNSSNVTFSIGEDALLKRRDGRYYLGKIIDFHCKQYLVQFDDKRSSGQWSSVDELRKLNTIGVDKAMCVSCKQINTSDIVETCERCGRGYHQKCTDKLNGDWVCKRCFLPMKIRKTLKTKLLEESLLAKINTTKTTVLQLPYELSSLNWDEKHRVNLEQIYCYCGKVGQFDYNMLKCCKCKQWFHLDCMQCSRKTVLRGDCFFVFACSVCNKGSEFIRRLELQWVDLVHVIMFNLTVMKNRQKYHHLERDIWPFALEKRSSMHISQEMCEMTKVDFETQFLKTLKENSKRFQCGSEIKKDHFCWGLRKSGPPIMPDIHVEPHEHLSNSFITNKLGLTLLEGAPENILRDANLVSEESDKSSKNIDTLEKGEKVDEKFETDDEIPIKDFLQKAKKSNASEKNLKSKTADLDEISLREKSKILKSVLKHTTKGKLSKNTNGKDETSNKQGRTTTDKVLNHLDKNSQGQYSKSSRKRKAFTLPKSYKHSSPITSNRSLDCSSGLINRICDSSSDENSSSSRGTLDLIIPPPENFLGLNNPFRITSPRKGEQPSSLINMTTSVAARKSVGFNKSINKNTNNNNSKNFATGLDFSSKLQALKSSGLFSNLSNSDLAKAAGQPRLVRTFKRRLSVKDITIGPNQEIRRRRTRRLLSSIEVISETTINSITNNFFPIHAKDIATAPIAANTSLSSSTPSSTSTTTNSKLCLTSVNPSNSSSTSTSTSPHTSSSILNSICTANLAAPFHGRRLRQRPDKSSPNNSRRNSLTHGNNTVQNAASVSSINDLKQSVNKYFGAANRIKQGEQFCIKAKRKLSDGQTQYLIEWSDSFPST